MAITFLQFILDSLTGIAISLSDFFVPVIVLGVFALVYRLIRRRYI